LAIETSNTPVQRLSVLKTSKTAEFFTKTDVSIDVLQ